MQTATVNRWGLGIARGSCGSITGDGTGVNVNLGFKPKYVMVFNETDVIKWEKMDGQADANCIKTVAAGTMTKDTTSAIVVTSGGFSLSAALAASGKACYWYAE